MTDRIINIGIIGAGNNACDVHIPNFLKMPNVKITHVCNRSYESGLRVSKKFNIPHVASDWVEIISDPTVDAILIGTWPYMHKILTCAALEKNKHVLCEARMAMNLQEAQEMLKAAKTFSSCVSQLVPARFTFPIDKILIDLIKKNKIGKIFHVEVKHNSDKFFDRTTPLTWRQDVKKSGNNILSMGIWYESIVRWLGEASEVFANGQVIQTTRIDTESNRESPVEIVDHIDICANFKMGATAHLQFSSVANSSKENGVWLYAEEATLFFDFSKKTLFHSTRNSNSLEPYPVDNNSEIQWRVEQDFIGSIINGDPVTLTNFSEGVKYMAFTEAVANSLKTKSLVKVENYV